jgi:hypothetical protein
MAKGKNCKAAVGKSEIDFNGEGSQCKALRFILRML